MPSIAPLRIDSEEVVFWAMVDAFGGPIDPSTRTMKRPTSPNDVLFPERGFNPEVDDPSALKCIEFIHLISQGNDANLLSDGNKFHLARLGQAILSESTDPRLRKFAEHARVYLKKLEQTQSSATPEQRALDDWWIDPDNLPMWPPQVKKTEMSVGQELDLRFFDLNKAHRVRQKHDLGFFDISEAHPGDRLGGQFPAMIGLLALRINSNGLGAQEEEAIRMLGGSPEHFRACVAQMGGQESEGKRSLFGLTGTLSQSSRFIVAALRSGYDTSCLFDGLTTDDLNGMLSDVAKEYLTKIIEQVEARHARVMQGPAATGERRILSGTAVWASNLTEHLPNFYRLNHLDFSNLSLDSADFSIRKMAGCRFYGSNLRGACFNDTDLSNSRFGTADLTGAQFNKNTDLTGADLSEANLSGLGPRFFDQTNAKVLAQLADLNAPQYNSTTRFLPESWDNPFRRLTSEEKELQKKRFEGWTPEQVEFVARNVGVFQGGALKQLAKLLREDAKNSLILPPRDQSGSAQEFLPDTVLGHSNAREIETALSRHQVYIDSAGLPVLKGNHNGKDLTHHDLRGAFVVGASLVKALMPNQDLEGICISNANLSGIDLRGANLTDAILVNVDLSGADLRGVDLTRTRFVNCNLDRVLLDGVKMLDTQMQQCTVSNITIGEGVIDDLLVCQTILENISFAGRLDGKGLFVRGIGLFDSRMTNAQFSGSTTVHQIELLGSLFVGSGPGILDNAEIIVSRESEWRDRMIQVAKDARLGEITFELKYTGDTLEEIIGWGGQQHGTVSRFEHLRGIGYQPGKLITNSSAERDQWLILPPGAR